MSHKKFRPDRFSRFDVYWIQTNRQTNKQTDRQAKFICRWILQIEPRHDLNKFLHIYVHLSDLILFEEKYSYFFVFNFNNLFWIRGVGTSSRIQIKRYINNFISSLLSRSILYCSRSVKVMYPNVVLKTWPIGYLINHSEHLFYCFSLGLTIRLG